MNKTFCFVFLLLGLITTACYAIENNCDGSTCKTNEWCCQRYWYSSPFCVMYKWPDFYKCQNVSNSTTRTLAPNCGREYCYHGQYCCRQYEYSSSSCYDSSRYHRYCDKIFNAITLPPTPTTPPPPTNRSYYNCGGSCPDGVYCCKKYNNYSTYACYYPMPKNYYGCSMTYTGKTIGDRHSLGTGEIIGIIFGAIALIVLIVLACVYCYFKLKNKQSTRSKLQQNTTNMSAPTSEQRV